MFLLLASMHLIGLGLLTMLLVMFLRSDTIKPWSPPDDDEGGGGPPLIPDRPVSPSPGGIPLPDAQPSPMRLREPGRLADHHHRPQRRPSREPDRTPARLSSSRRP